MSQHPSLRLLCFVAFATIPTHGSQDVGTTKDRLHKMLFTLKNEGLWKEEREQLWKEVNKIQEEFRKAPKPKNEDIIKAKHIRAKNKEMSSGWKALAPKASEAAKYAFTPEVGYFLDIALSKPDYEQYTYRGSLNVHDEEAVRAIASEMKESEGPGKHLLEKLEAMENGYDTFIKLLCHFNDLTPTGQFTFLNGTLKERKAGTNEFWYPKRLDQSMNEYPDYFSAPAATGTCTTNEQGCKMIAGNDDLEESNTDSDTEDTEFSGNTNGSSGTGTNNGGTPATPSMIQTGPKFGVIIPSGSNDSAQSQSTNSDTIECTPGGPRSRSSSVVTESTNSDSIELPSMK